MGEATEFTDFPRCTNGARAAAMNALVNFTHTSDANRQLLVELKGLPPIVDAAMNSPVNLLRSLVLLNSLPFMPSCDILEMVFVPFYYFRHHLLFRL
jgi:hypothetical protein